MGKSREAVSNTLRLLNLPTEVQNAVSKNQINESQARLLLTMTNPAVQKQLFQDILANNLTVRQLRHRIQKAKSSVEKSFGASSDEYEIKHIEEKLKEALGAPVKIQKKGEGGEIIISFYSPEEIYGFIQKINPSSND